MDIVLPSVERRKDNMSDVSALETTTTFWLTLSMTPGIPENEDLTHSIMDGVAGSYLQGLQEHLKTLGIDVAVRLGIQRIDYAHPRDEDEQCIPGGYQSRFS